MTRRKRYLIILFAVLGCMIVLGILAIRPAKVVSFDENRAYEDIKMQLSFGPRVTGSDVQDKFIEWLSRELYDAGWQYSIKEAEAMNHPIKNIFAHRSNQQPDILLVAHYDSRLLADNDPDPANHTQPVPGANDGASGVAVLLELARVLPERTIPVGLVFVDAEDNGRIEGWDWILGSRAFVESLDYKPQAVIVVDMVGDSNLNIYKEKFSDPALTDQLWAVAKELGYGEFFIEDSKHHILDDHVPFLEVGIPAVDIIDIDYPYDPPRPETFSEKPRKVDYGVHDISFRHYGKSIELMIKSAFELPDSPERDALINVIANHMKKSYLTWNRESVDDEVILKDLLKLSGGQVEISKIKLSETRELLNKGKKPQKNKSFKKK